MFSSTAANPVEAMRCFNRFYTRQIGVLHEKLLRSPFSLTEARVIYELAHQEAATARELIEELNLDPGYFSRIARDFTQRGLIDKQPSPADGRQSILRLTPAGQEAFAHLNAASRREIEAMLGDLSPLEQDTLVHAMRTIEDLLAPRPESRAPRAPAYILRPPIAGDMGWIIQRHGALYAQEYGWNAEFEALVAEICAAYVRNYDPARERCWIAEQDGENVGSIFLVKGSDTVAKLRLMLVEPRARGMGIATRMVDECIRFARQAGYERITLWTNSVLTTARRIYERAGFRLIHEEAHHSFGHHLVGETWELRL